MCGVFGIIKETGTIAEQEIELLISMNVHRSNGKLGLIWLKRGEDERTRFGVAKYSYKDFGLVMPEGCYGILGHLLAATNGEAESIDRCHPIAHRGLYVAHNGILTEVDRYPDWRVTASMDVDTQFILGGVHHWMRKGLSINGAIGKTAEALAGQQACWLYRERTSQIAIWRVMSPLFVGRLNGGFAFSSVGFPEVNNMIEQGVVYGVTSGGISTLNFFSFKSIY